MYVKRRKKDMYVQLGGREGKKSTVFTKNLSTHDRLLHTKKTLKTLLDMLRKLLTMTASRFDRGRSDSARER